MRPHIVVHAVHERKAICGFTQARVDAGWEPGNLWTEATNRQDVTCPACCEKLDSGWIPKPSQGRKLKDLTNAGTA